MKKHNDRKLTDILSEFVHHKPIEKGYWQTKVDLMWKEHLGNTINKYTRKIRLRNGILDVYLDSAPLRQELSYSKPKLVSFLNEKIGEDRIKEIRLH